MTATTIRGLKLAELADVSVDKRNEADESPLVWDRNTRMFVARPAGGGGAAVTDAVLKAWAQAEAYEATAITRDSDGVVTTATVKWPDGSAGTFTTTTKNATYLAVDAYTVTHTASGKTVTQAAVTRDSNGSVTVKPALTVA